MNFSNQNPQYKQSFSDSNIAPQKKVLTTEEKIDKIFFRTATIEKDLAALLHANGMASSNKFLNNN